MSRAVRTSALLLALLVGLAGREAAGLVRYDEGRRVVEGIQLLQDAEDDKAFYYLPQFPRLAVKDGDTLEFLCVKYVGADDVPSGGLFHALFEFTLPPDVVEEVQQKLRADVPGAVLRGPVPLLDAVDSGESGLGGFRIVSATLSEPGSGGFTRRLVSSGRAPLTPGSKAAVAALLEPAGATLLWETLSAPTSDVSVAISARYEALVKAYGARVTAEVETLYTHFRELSNEQAVFTKAEVQHVADELVRSGDLRVEVMDRSQGLGVDPKAMEGLLELVTTQLTDLLFDAESGFAKEPERERPGFEGQIPGRLEPGWLQQTFGLTDTPYRSDVQYALKERSDVRRSRFVVDLSKSTTVQVPVDSAGNLGGLYAENKDDPRYFRIVNLADPVFEERSLHFQLDGATVDAFQDTVNFATVNFRKHYGEDKPDVTKSLVFTHEDVKGGVTVKSLSYPRLGDRTDAWRDYEYQVRWSVRDRPTVAVPADPDAWIASRDPAVALVPPFEKRVVEIDADRSLFRERGIATAVVEFATPLVGKPKLKRKATLRAGDGSSTTVVSLYADRDQPVAWRVTWHTRSGPIRGDAAGLDSDYLYLVPPEPDGGATPSD